jgi:hypothetical protein
MCAEIAKATRSAPAGSDLSAAICSCQVSLNASNDCLVALGVGLAGIGMMIAEESAVIGSAVLEFFVVKVIFLALDGKDAVFWLRFEQ